MVTARGKGARLDAREAWSARAAFAAEAALVVALAYVVATVTWTLVDPSVLSAPVSAPGGGAQPGRPAALETTSFRAGAGGANPFRSGAIADAGPAADVDATAPETTLNLTVAGARTSSGAGDGSAIIVTPDSVQRVYHVGDTILDGVELYRIEDERILLRRDGVIEALPFATDQLSVLNGVAASRTSTLEAVPAADAPPARVPAAALMASVQPRPAPDGNGGVALYPRGDGAAFAAAGFEPGDVVLSVNGAAVADAERLTRILVDLGPGSFVNAQVARGGATASLQFELE